MLKYLSRTEFRISRVKCTETSEIIVHRMEWSGNLLNYLYEIRNVLFIMANMRENKSWLLHKIILLNSENYLFEQLLREQIENPLDTGITRIDDANEKHGCTEYVSYVI